MKRRVAKRSPLLLMASLLALTSFVGGAGATSRADSVRWTIRVERLIGRLPLSVSVAERGRLVYAHAGNVLRQPASDEKLLLSMALLDRFGAHYRISTTVEGSHPANGSVRGNLWLVGHGDPELNDATLARLAHQLSASGIRAVRGSVIGVTNTFTRERWAPGWQPIALRFIALPTALVFDANTSPRGFVFDPERRAAAALTADLRALDVRVTGHPRDDPQPAAADSILATTWSAPLIAILRRQNVDSLNLDAEVLTKMLGATVFGPPGSIAKGAQAIQRWARHHGAEVVAHDGSGLSYTNSISTNAIARLLSTANSSGWGSALRSTLPGAAEGTLAGRLIGLRVRAKTGTLLKQVSALSGWVWLQRQHRWAEFSILSRGLSKPQAVLLEDGIVSIIAKQA